MNKLIGEFHQHFDAVVLHADVKEESSFHIFHLMQNAFSAETRLGDRLQMYHHFNSYEKSLQYARNGNLIQAKFWIDYIDRYPLSIPGNVQKGMKSLYFAMVAFYHYSRKEYAEAIAGLKKATLMADELSEKELPVMKTSCFEQTLNLCRVYYTMKEYELAFKESGALLLYMTTGQSLQKPGLSDLKEFNSTQTGLHAFMLRYVTDSLLSRMFHVEKIKEVQEKEIYHSVFHLLWEQEDWTYCPIPGYEQALKGLQAFLEGDPEKGIANTRQTGFTQLPSRLQWVLLLKISGLASQNGYHQTDKLKESFHTYTKRVIKSGEKAFIKQTPEIA